MRYEEVTDNAYAEHATGFHIEESPDHTIVLHGTCPRCHHVMEYVISDSVTKRSVSGTGSGTTPTPEPTVEEMCCTCDQEHQGRPKDYLGCGAYWDLVLTAS
jgi:hypothetical protein